MASQPDKVGALTAAALTAGGLALLGAGVVDLASVAGRHLGRPLIGAIEVVQALVVVAASISLVAATLARVHAAVHVLTERAPVGVQRALARFGALLGAAFFLALFAGSVWLLADVWGSDERSDLLGLPIVPLRVLWCLAALATAAFFLVQAFTGKPDTAPTHDA